MRTFTKIFLVLAMLLMVAGPAIAMAEDVVAQQGKETTMIVPIGGLTDNTVSPATYVNTIYKWAIGLAALLALAQLVFGGVLYTLSAGSLANQEEAKGKIKGAIVGLIILIVGVTLLTTINPSLTNLKQAEIDSGLYAQDAEATRVTGEDLARAKAASEALEKAGRLAEERNQFNIECKKTADALIERLEYSQSQKGLVGEALSKAKRFINWAIPLVGIYNAISGDPGTDFATVLKKAAENKSSNQYLYHCYQDAVIAALGYVKGNIFGNDFALLVKQLVTLPAESEVNIYLNTDNPAGRNNATVDTMESEFSMQDEEVAKIYLLARENLFNKKINESVAIISELVGSRNAEENAVKTAIWNLLRWNDMRYKNKTITLAQYEEFVNKIKPLLTP